MKLTDYIAAYLADRGIGHVFLITGGAVAHLVDSLGKSDRIKYVCVQHEQAAAMAAEAYSRVTGNLGVAAATSGPGATNLITGACCAYFDSIPTLFLSGQVNQWETKGDRKIRQLGFQETDIIDVVRPITKYASMVVDPLRIRYELDKALHIARSGRPGPVWLDIPMNVQHAEIDPDSLAGYEAEAEPGAGPITEDTLLAALSRLERAKRPVIIAGSGIKLAAARAEFDALLTRVRVPVVSTWSGIDILPHDHPLYVGQFGVYGNRAANFTVQNADLILSIGSRLDTRQTGGQPKTFARGAFKIVVDVDEAELSKGWVQADLTVCADARNFLLEFTGRLQGEPVIERPQWLERAMEWKRRYPAVLPEWYAQKNSVNAYVFVKTLSEQLRPGAVVVADQGGNLTWTVQAFQIKAGQMLFSAFGNSPMGYALPAAVGAAFGRPGQDIICIDGDGGFQLNIQELQTIAHYRLPIKIFILNNRSYGIIKQFQEVYFGGRYEATVSETGYTAPDFRAVAGAYGIPSETIGDHDELAAKLPKILTAPGPLLVDVRLAEDQKLIPKLVAVKTSDGRYISKPIEDMIPLLPRDEFRANMIVDPLPEEGGEAKAKEIN